VQKLRENLQVANFAQALLSAGNNELITIAKQVVDIKHAKEKRRKAEKTRGSTEDKKKTVLSQNPSVETRKLH